MRSVRVLCVVVACVWSMLAGRPRLAAAQTPLSPNLSEPAIAPDRTEIAFVCGGDIWSVRPEGGSARLLVAAGGTLSRPMFSPDGKRIAFVNSRADARGIDVLTLDGGAIVRLTHDDVTPELDGWSPDGRSVLFSSSAHNIAYFSDVYAVPLGGGTPMKAIGEPYVNATQAAVSVDGGIAYVRNGFVQWWRRGHSHIDQSAIVVARAAGKFETLTDGAARDRWPMWSPDGSTLYFVSDRSGSDEIWRRRGRALTRLTQLAGRPVLWPTISRDGRVIAFEHDFAIWTLDLVTGAVARVPIDLRGGIAGVRVAHLTQSARFSALSVAPDGNKLAFVARSRVFVAATANDDVAQAVPPVADAAYDLPVWAPDSRRLAYVVDRGARQALAVAELPEGLGRVVTPAGHNDDYPHWSPDGNQLAFVRDGRELHVLDLATRADRIVARGTLDRRPFGDRGDIAFSPAGDQLAYIDTRAGFANVRAVPVGGGEDRAVTFLPNASAGPLAWSPDGTRIFVCTGQRTEPGAVAMIDLIPRPPHFREDALRSLFDAPVHEELPSHALATPVPTRAPSTGQSAPPAASRKRTTIDFDGIGQRVTILPTGLDVSDVTPAPDGKSLVLVAAAAGQQNLYTFSIDETAATPPVARQLTGTPGPKSGVWMSADGRTVYYLDGGAIWNVGVDGSNPRRHALTAAFDVDFARDKELVFAQAWSILERWFADPHFHGVDWEAIGEHYAPAARAARTSGELRRVISLMLGELDSSHLGINAPPNPAGPPWTTGRLGVEWDPATYARSGRLRVAQTTPLGPAAAAGIAVGDEILAVDGVSLDASTDIDAVLANHVGIRTTVRVAPGGDAAAARTVAVLPVDTPTAKLQLYRGWVQSRRAYVERHSNGRLGYVHLLDMTENSLARFYRDLDVLNREKDGVVVDVRNNTGGFVDPYAIDVLTRREYARFEPRFGSTSAERTALGQRVLDRPTVLVTNAHSLSDAENFTEAYRALRAGPVVGEPTAGWIIFTSITSLVDESSFSVPTVRVFGRDGVEMERHPRPVDVRVDNPPDAAPAGRDPQLDAAIRELTRIVAHARR